MISFEIAFYLQTVTALIFAFATAILCRVVKLQDKDHGKLASWAARMAHELRENGIPVPPDNEP